MLDVIRQHIETLLIPIWLLACAPAVATWETVALPDEQIQEFGTQYLVYLPPKYASEANHNWPTILYLHTRAEWGNQLDRLKTNGLPEYLTTHDLDAVVIAPLSPANQMWQPVFVDKVLQDAQKRYRIDQKRLYLTGASMGAMGAWNMAIAFPSRFAAFVPISGGLYNDVASMSFGAAIAPTAEVLEPLRRVQRIPTWIVYGDHDAVVPPEIMQRSDKLLRLAGGAVTTTVIPNGGHDAWTAAYAGDPEVLTWMLAKEKPDADWHEPEVKLELLRYVGTYFDKSGLPRATVSESGPYLKVMWNKSGAMDLLIALDQNHFIGTGLVEFELEPTGRQTHAIAIKYYGLSRYEFR